MNTQAIMYIKRRLEVTSFAFKKWLFEHPDLKDTEHIKKRDRFITRIEYYLLKGTTLDYYFLDEDDEIRYRNLLKFVVTMTLPVISDVGKFDTYVTESGKHLYYYIKP